MTSVVPSTSPYWVGLYGWYLVGAHSGLPTHSNTPFRVRPHLLSGLPVQSMSDPRVRPCPWYPSRVPVGPPTPTVSGHPKEPPELPCRLEDETNKETTWTRVESTRHEKFRGFTDRSREETFDSGVRGVPRGP